MAASSRGTLPARVRCGLRQHVCVAYEYAIADQNAIANQDAISYKDTITEQDAIAEQDSCTTEDGPIADRIAGIGQNAIAHQHAAR